MVRSTLRVLGGWRGAAVQKAEDVVGDRLGLFEVQEVPRAEDSPTFVMYRSSPAMKLAVARIARIRQGLAGLEGVATPGGAEEFTSMGCSPSRQACAQPVR
ncbi:hypothetical protein [Streptomyces torulosus]|uniref:hypothetical protein n=1 Tax=Streptomyces torulosus TaxID=68276 RepID=UPI0012FF0693|nr:hypothetical protein [Streptomyces torulosus]